MQAFQSRNSRHPPVLQLIQDLIDVVLDRSRTPPQMDVYLELLVEWEPKARLFDAIELAPITILKTLP